MSERSDMGPAGAGVSTAPRSETTLVVQQAGSVGKDSTIRHLSPGRTAALAATLVAITLGGGCSSPEAERPTAATRATSSPVAIPAPVSPTRASSAPAPATKKPVVLLISVDGLNPDAITQLDAQGRVPTLRLLLREGASTLNARTAYEQTNTLPNHTGMLTGRPISGPEGTRVTFNTDHPGSLRSLNGRYLPGVFDPVHDAGLSTLFLAEKTKFAFLIRSWDATGGAPDVTGKDNGRNKLDFADVDADPDRLTDELLSRLRSGPPRFTFLHIAGPDEAGHGDRVEGFMGRKYLNAVEAADDQLATILAEVRTNPKLVDRTTIILTADHGGRGLDVPPGYGHRGPGVLDNYRIPFIVWGPQVPAGKDLYSLNRPGRRDPGDSRVGYSGPQPIRNLDAANLVLSLFGLPALPATLPDGRAPLRVR